MIGGTISTVAGNGGAGFGGDGGPATLATLDGPSAIAVDALGDLLIADTLNGRIREVVAGSHTILTLAGDGNPNSSGDGRPATAAEINVPDGLVVDSLRHLFVAEAKGNRVRLLTMNAAVSDTVSSSATIAAVADLVGLRPVGDAHGDDRHDRLRGGPPGGAVTFVDGTTVLGTAILNATGTATLTLKTLGVGSHSIAAVYSGDSTFQPSSSAALTETVARAQSTATLTASTASSVYGQSVTFRATIKAMAPGSGTPTGTVTFTDKTANTVLGTVSLSGGVASLAIKALGVGGHTIVATYSGDANFQASGSASVTETVNQAATTTALSASATSAKAGTAITFTAAVEASRPRNGHPDGVGGILPGRRGDHAVGDGRQHRQGKVGHLHADHGDASNQGGLPGRQQ